MIVVTVELWPQGNEKAKKHLGTAKISNNLTGTKNVGNYNVVLSQKGRPDSIWRSASIKGFKRLSYGHWELLAGAIIGALGDRIEKAFTEPSEAEDAKA